MSRHKVKTKRRWLVGLGLMLVAMLVLCLLLGFNITIAIGVLIVEGSILLILGEHLKGTDKRRALPYPYFVFGMLMIIVGVIALYLIGQAAYTLGESYSYWLMNLHNQGQESIDFEIGTLIMVYYVIGITVYGRTIWGLAKKEINNWLPNLWCLLLGIGLMMYSREGYNHAIRIGTLLIGSGLLMSHLIYRSFISRAQWIQYRIKPKAYLGKFLICLLGIWVIGIFIPEYQELPGARWVRNIVNSFGVKPNLHQKILYESRLNNDVPLSNAVLFEVKASEPLYLRDMAYTEYSEGAWRIPEQEEGYKDYIEFKPQYLEAEYHQTATLLDEIAFQNGAQSSLLSKYVRYANYESNIIRKRTYTVLQNPINKINYFTVNGFSDIMDDKIDKVYYYQNLNNCYFHSKSLVEPSQYQVIYYDRVPKVGSREYMFLRNSNATIWENLYNAVIANKNEYSLYDDKLTKILIQYNNAKEMFLQVPDELKSVLEEFASNIIGTQESDWSKVELICNFLKNHYTYRLQNKRIEGERVSSFLFEEKEGICQDFATSMTLMCRSIGIPAKYVTGYLASEKSKESGNYIIREKDAHAFVEVYIAGYGWMSFDPTPNRELEETQGEHAALFSLDDYIRLIAIGSIIFVVVVIWRGGLSYFEEKWWLLTFRFTKTEKQLERLLLRQNVWLERLGLKKMSYETLSQYALRLKEKQIDILISVQFYEKQKYGGIEPSKRDIQEAYEAYKTLKVTLKKLK